MSRAGSSGSSEGDSVPGIALVLLASGGITPTSAPSSHGFFLCVPALAFF